MQEPRAPDTIGGNILRPVGSFRFKAPAKAWEPDPSPPTIVHKRPNTRVRPNPRVITNSRSIPHEKEAFRSALLGCAVKLHELNYDAQAEQRSGGGHGGSALRYLLFLREASQRMPLLGKDLRTLLLQIAARMEKLTFFRGVDKSERKREGKSYDVVKYGGCVEDGVSEQSGKPRTSGARGSRLRGGGILYRDQALGALEELKARKIELAQLQQEVVRLSEERLGVFAEVDSARARLEEVETKLVQEEGRQGALEKELDPLRTAFAKLQEERNVWKQTSDATNRERFHTDDDVDTITSMIEHEQEDLRIATENFAFAIEEIRKGVPAEKYKAITSQIACDRMEERELERENEQLLSEHVAILHQMALHESEKGSLLSEKERIEDNQAEFLRAHTPRPKWEEGAVIASEVTEFVDSLTSAQVERNGTGDNKGKSTGEPSDSAAIGTGKCTVFGLFRKKERT